MTSDRLYMVFDVESIGLHGEGFAVAWLVVDEDGRHIASAAYACDPDRARGDDTGRAWVAEHVPWQGIARESSPRWVRERFWEAWTYAKKKNAMLAADVAWPVEANFLSACIADDPREREWGGPYPLIDVSSVLLAAGSDADAAPARTTDESEHDPLGDARQSARLLIQALKRLADLPSVIDEAAV